MRIDRYDIVVNCSNIFGHRIPDPETYTDPHYPVFPHTYGTKIFTNDKLIWVLFSPTGNFDKEPNF
jgi:hypothetical protein